MLQRLFLAPKPVFECQREEVPDVDDFGRMTSYNGRAEHTGVVTTDLDVQAIVDDVDNLVDDKRHGAAAIREDEQWLRPFAFHAYVLAHGDERHQMAAVLNHVTTI